MIDQIFVNSILNKLIRYMKTIEIEITDDKALKLLLDMEEMHLIKVIRNRSPLSALRKQIKSPMTEQEIDSQLNTLRNEWRRDI